METEDTLQSQEPKEETDELSHTDKIVGVISEPKNLFDKIKSFPIKHIDWLLPLLVYIVVSIISGVLIMNNPEIKYQIKQFQEKQVQEISKQFDEKVKKGEMSEEQKEQSLEMTRSTIEFMSGPIMSNLIIVFFTIIGFFFMSLVYFLFGKVFFKSDISYSEVMVVRGLPVYILVLQGIIMTLIIMFTNKLITDLSLGAFLNVEKLSFLGYLLSRIDLFTIWFYTVISLGLIKYYKNAKPVHVFLAVFLFWFIGDAITFLLGMVPR